MLTDKELQSLRNMGNECEQAADEIDKLRERLRYIPHVVQYMRKDNSDNWRDMAAFDSVHAAAMYAKSCANETWKYRVIAYDFSADI